MWQVLVAAAVAGSGVFVKHLLLDRDFKSDPHLCSSQPSLKADQISDETPTQIPSKPSEEYVFRFSSTSVSPGEDGCGAKKSKKKLGRGSRGGGKSGYGNGDVGDKKFGGLEDGNDCLVVDQRKSGKRFVVCLKKKRRTSKYASAKSESCPRKDDLSFALGLGAGLMYMMSAGRSEISRLNSAIDETAKVVQELKTELARRKSSRTPDSPSLRAEENTKIKRSRGNNSQALLNDSSSGNINNRRLDGSFLSNEGECGSSCLTEELQPGVLMDQLEAELESELQKIHWGPFEASGPEKSSDTCEASTISPDPEPIFGVQSEVLSDSAEEINRLDGLNLKTYQHNGVLPSELDKKLRHVLHEQQESQIVELESALQHSHSKLNEKEVELQKLKDCIRHLTKVSLDCASDEEIETQKNQESSDPAHDIMGPESKKTGWQLASTGQWTESFYKRCWTK